MSYITNLNATTFDSTFSFFENSLNELNKINILSDINLNNINLLNSLEIDFNNKILNTENLFSTKKKVLTTDLIYPIGSIYIGDDNTNPNTLFNNQSWQEITNTVISDNDFMNAWYNTTGLTIETASDGSKWFTIYNHNSNSGKNIFTPHTAMSCNTTNSKSFLWTLLCSEKPFLNNDNNFEFQVTYPDYSSTGLNHWIQSSNPLTTYDTVRGYSAISMTWSSGFDGLSRQNSDYLEANYCLLGGRSGSTNWWYCIAPYEKYDGGLPGPQNVIITGRTILKIRVPMLEQEHILYNRESHKYWKRIS